MTNRTHHPIRMCARCERMTDTPVLVHEVHAATGPGFNVYACRECADHYPPLTDALELLEQLEEPPTQRHSRLTLRVYKINPQGTVTEDRGKVEVLANAHTDPPPHTSAFPPCRCPRCRLESTARLAPNTTPASTSTSPPPER
jgi:hypothetical protein